MVIRTGRLVNTSVFYIIGRQLHVLESFFFFNSTPTWQLPRVRGEGVKEEWKKEVISAQG